MRAKKYFRDRASWDKTEIEALAKRHLPEGWAFRWAKTGELGGNVWEVRDYSKTIVMKRKKEPLGYMLYALAHAIADSDKQPGDAWKVGCAKAMELQKELERPYVS
jgi:hypothetical protein